MAWCQAHGRISAASPEASLALRQGSELTACAPLLSCLKLEVCQPCLLLADEPSTCWRLFWGPNMGGYVNNVAQCCCDETAWIGAFKALASLLHCQTGLRALLAGGFCSCRPSRTMCRKALL